MNELLLIAGITAIAGIGGTGLGGVIGALFRKDSSRTVSLLLSFASGVMLSIVCFDLVLDAIQPDNALSQTNIFIILICIALGVLVVYGLNYIIDRRTNCEVPHIDANHPETADALDELIHSDHLMVHMEKKDSKKSLFVAGIVMVCAIALHNVPEGMTIGASMASEGTVGAGSGMVLAVLIGLHNIPEGMSVAVPLISGGMRKTKAVLITASSGAPTVIGAIFGYWLGDLGPLSLAVSLSLASGAMLYVVFGEILPQAILMYRSKLPAFSVVFGMLVGLMIIYA